MCFQQKQKNKQIFQTRELLSIADILICNIGKQCFRQGSTLVINSSSGDQLGHALVRQGRKASPTFAEAEHNAFCTPFHLRKIESKAWEAKDIWTRHDCQYGYTAQGKYSKVQSNKRICVLECFTSEIAVCRMMSSGQHHHLCHESDMFQNLQKCAMPMLQK